MNVSPHHQRPTKYPWPGRASAAWVVLALAAVLLIGFLLLSGSPADENAEASPTGSRVDLVESIFEGETGGQAGDTPRGPCLT